MGKVIERVNEWGSWLLAVAGALGTDAIVTLALVAVIVALTAVVMALGIMRNNFNRPSRDEQP